MLPTDLFNQTWVALRHPHILRKIYCCGSVSVLRFTLPEFLGANAFDDNPFIVMPYRKNGNARDYVIEYPECDRVTIVCAFLYRRKISY